MSDDTKVLDVSYGTFSCRLEGFDDSVEVMKTVVSYFHELAGHDRFMDMDPQAPDMDTLARLTAEKTGETIDVEGEGQRVSLRIRNPELRVRKPIAAFDPEDDTLGAQEDGPLDANLTGEDDTALDDLDVDEDVDIVAAPENDLNIADAADDDIAEADEVPILDEDETGDITDDDDPADDVAQAEDPAVTQEDPAGDIADTDDTPAMTEQPIAQDDVPDEYADEDDSVAAKLQRIRSVVGRVPPTPANDSPAADTDEAETADAPAASAFSLRLAGLAQRQSPAAEEVTQEEPVETETDAPEASDHEDADESDVDALTPEEIAEFDDEAPTADAEIADDDTAQADIAGDSDTDEQVDDLSDQSGELADDPSGAIDLAAETGADSFDLHQEVAEIEREIAKRRENRSKRSEFPDNADDAMSRILTQADEKLNEPEGRRHRDAFAQLKAAVAATEAARQLGDAGIEAKDPGEAFRGDLDDAVRDQKTVENESTADDTADEVTDEATPLKLVSAQRVEDAAQPLDLAANRLRQIASQKETSDTNSGGFAEFAKQKGATELVDLLEAAAAYIAFVEGDDDFSRPQVMKKVQSASSDQFSREDGLRSFGRLLRQSRIIKLNNGRFQVSEDTRFRPDGKAAQG